MKPWHFAALLLCAGNAAQAAQVVEPPAGGPFENVRQFVAGELARAQPKLRADIFVGEIDPRLHLAPCQQSEVFLRPGARLWGRSYVGLRCLQGAPWSVSVPVTVRLYGLALVANQSLAAMQQIPASAVRSEEIELTREPGPVAAEWTEVEDHTCTHPIESGQPIPLNCLHSTPAIGQGDAVKLVGVGSGFLITTEATSLATVAAGESVRVRTEAGRTVSGIARKGRIVEVAF